jgi:hypothetical protein
MDLTPEQKAVISEWAARGDSLSDIQKQIKEQFNINLTYIDVRLLVLDLDVSIADKVDPQEARKKAEAQAASQPDIEDGLLPDDVQDIPAGDSSVSVELDTVVVPGAIVSGSVVFSDGVKATWAVDQMGRLSVGASDPAYQPSPEDIQVFQLELQRLLQQIGF